MEIVNGLPVIKAFVDLDKWDGCSWVLKDGSVLAVEYAEHYYAARAHSGDSSIYSSEFSDRYRALHVGSWVFSSHRPTKAQKDALVTLATHYPYINGAMKDQKWMILDNEDRPCWQV